MFDKLAAEEFEPDWPLVQRERLGVEKHGRPTPADRPRQQLNLDLVHQVLP